MFCALLCVHCSFAIILMGKGELVALLCLSSRYLRTVVWLFLTMPQVCLQFVIEVFPDHTHYFCLRNRCLHMRKAFKSHVLTYFILFYSIELSLRKRNLA